MKSSIISVLLFTFLFSISSFSQFSSVRIQIIDVGQADGILIRTPNTKWILIDAGTSKKLSQSLKTVWNVDTLSLAIVSHRHDDHYGGMADVLRNFPVKFFLGNMEDCPDRSTDDTIRSIINLKGINVQQLGVDTISIDGVHVIVFPQHPSVDCPEDENDNSVVVKLVYGEFSMIFPGDAETGELDWLVQNCPDYLDATILKASHHGSDNGTTDAWLNTITPKAVVISAGVHGTYKHPHLNAVNKYIEETGGKLFSTNRHGTITIYGYQDDRIRILTQRTSNKSIVYDGTYYDE